MRIGRKTKPQSSKDAGSSMVEFALAVVPLLLLLFGFVNFGVLMFSLVNVQHAAAEGARFGITGRQLRDRGELLSREESIRRTVKDAIVIPGGREAVNIEISGLDRLQTLNILVTYPYRMLIPSFLGRDLQVNLRGRAVMRNENFPETPPR